MLKAKKRALLIAFAFVLVLVSLTALCSADKPPETLPVIVTFQDDLNTIARIKSDGSGPYICGVDYVRAVIVILGNVALDTDTNGDRPGGRKLFLDFGDPVDHNNAPPPFSSMYTSAFMSTTKVQTLEGDPIDNNLRGMSIGQNALTNLNINFHGAGSCWFIRFDPNYTGATKVLVTRDSDDTWIIEAIGANQIAKLLSYPAKGKFVLTDRGNFRMPCEVIVKLK